MTGRLFISVAFALAGVCITFFSHHFTGSEEWIRNAGTLLVLSGIFIAPQWNRTKKK
ncbi:hypothetical protein [Domibacillus epiphyticus]|uniref:hypothetical protein n=1 Tax=Domibacillus epiphyticus TaxID=1714355 RepID=UPI0013010690|nr:hypothetical protein [Domibacillus epiphyticus]